MSCVFCGSFYHLSEFCEKYVSDEARKKIVRSKHVCEYYLKSYCEYPFCQKCKSIKKCYICYSINQHLTVFCPDRFKASLKLFIPNINQNLFQRFLEMFNAYEKQIIAFQSPAVFNNYVFQPIIIVDAFYISRFLHHPGSKIFVCKTFDLRNYTDIAKIHACGRIDSKIWTIIAEDVDIGFNQLVTCEDISLLFTQKLKIMKLKNVATLTTLDEIFERCPTLAEFEYDAIEDKKSGHSFLKFKYENDYKTFSITVHPYFKVYTLLAIMAKVKSNAKLRLYIDRCFYEICNPNHTKLLSKSFLKYFHRTKPKSYVFPLSRSLSIFLEKEDYKTWSSHYKFVGKYILRKKYSIS